MVPDHPADARDHVNSKQGEVEPERTCVDHVSVAILVHNAPDLQNRNQEHHAGDELSRHQHIEPKLLFAHVSVTL